MLERPDHFDDLPVTVRDYVEAVEAKYEELRTKHDELEAQNRELQNLSRNLGITIGENVRLKNQVNTLIHTLSVVISAEFVHVNTLENKS